MNTDIPDIPKRLNRDALKRLGEQVTGPLEITAVRSVGRLSKMYYRKNGKIVKESATRLVSGNARTHKLESIDELACLIDGLESNEALILGVFDSPRSRIKPQRRLSDADRRNGYRARTKRDVRQPRAGFALLDYDFSENMPEHLRVDSVESFMQLIACIPGLESVMYYGRSSSSAGIVDGGGEHSPLQVRFHVYLPLRGGTLESLQQWLKVKLWNAGLGYIDFASNGALLERTIIDSCVLSPERLIYAGPPVLRDGITREVPPDVLEPGGWLEGPFELDSAEIAAYTARVQQAKESAHVKDRSRAIRDQYIEMASLRRVAVHGVDIAQARDTERRNLSADGFGGQVCLDDDVLLDLGDQYLTVAQLKAHADQFDRRSIPDPVEGRQYGMGTAIFYSNAPRGVPSIHSFAHGVTTLYVLEAFSVEEPWPVAAET